ncbi:MAG: ECF transporter S component [Lachnospiraceae bacterium]
MRNQYDISQYMAARKKRTIMTALIIIFLIPITMFAGIYIFDDRKYLIISLLILIYTMLPFFMVFERRKPRAREIVMIAMMAALTACGNLICFMFGPFQAGTALVIISGISLGPEAGFLVGAIARFVVNFFSGQGPWTPWQMVCWGILGFLAGLVFNKVDIDKVQSRKFQIVIGPVVCIAFAIGSAYVTYRLSGSGPFIGWRLYIFGAIGLIIGLIIQRKRLPIDDITLPVYGFLTTFIITGGL